MAQAARAHHRSRLERAVEKAKQVYADEAAGPKLHRELARIAHDHTLVSALSRGDAAGAQGEADAQLRIPLNHFAHVTRISVVGGSHVLINATLVRRRTGLDVLARGASGRVRASLGAATEAHLPRSGTPTIAGSRYFVRSFHEICWGNEASAHEALTVWGLERA